MQSVSPDNSRLTPRAVAMMVVLGAAYFFSNFHRLSLSVIGDVISADLGLTSLQLATLGSAIFYSYALMQIPCGLIADRIPARKLIAGSCVLAAGATLWFACARSFVPLVLARILTGVATALVYVPALTVIRRQFGDEIYATMTGIMVAMGQLGSVCAAAPLKLIADLFHWRTAFLAIGGISLVLAVASRFLIPSPPAQGHTGAKGAWRSALTPGCLSIAFWFLVTGGARLSFQSLWGGRYFTQALEADSWYASLFLMLISIGCILGSVVLGRVADRVGSIPTVVGSTLVLAFTWAGFALLVPDTSPLLTGGLCLLLGTAGSGGFTVAFSCIRLFVGKEHTGAVTGIQNCCAFMGSALFTQLNGVVMDFAPTENIRGQFAFLLLLFALLALAAAVLVGAANRRRDA